MTDDLERLRFKMKTKNFFADHLLPIVVCVLLLVFALGLGLGMKIGFAAAHKQDASSKAH